ncbi:unnamed protein product [Lepeophtheirus salmonis]|uniref:(salmon louse) hypothetical protein n=1 Tax=Lepeophtheirus salmonis TaxID=72036 RepID=A0A7R8CML7_LEPSM|nr:unnamed protein product [Lepeophtheirus salmonis]CAF2867501.1 unnamed protein product [Lepeophtheirus salmonis]
MLVQRRVVLHRELLVEYSTVWDGEWVRPEKNLGDTMTRVLKTWTCQNKTGMRYQQKLVEKKVRECDKCNSIDSTLKRCGEGSLLVEFDWHRLAIDVIHVCKNKFLTLVDCGATMFAVWRVLRSGVEDEYQSLVNLSSDAYVLLPRPSTRLSYFKNSEEGRSFGFPTQSLPPSISKGRGIEMASSYTNSGFCSLEAFLCLSIKKDLDNLCLPQYIHETFNEDCAIFFTISTVGVISELLYDLQIRRYLSFNMFFHSKPVLQSEIRHICGLETIPRFSDISNILAFMKNKSGISHQLNILMAKKLLEYIPEEKGSEYNDHISFIIKQLQLHLSLLKGQRNSSRLLEIALFLQNTSPALYNQLCESRERILPSIKYSKKLSRAFNIDRGCIVSTSEYLQR